MMQVRTVAGACLVGPYLYDCPVCCVVGWNAPPAKDLVLGPYVCLSYRVDLCVGSVPGRHLWICDSFPLCPSPLSLCCCFCFVHCSRSTSMSYRYSQCSVSDCETAFRSPAFETTIPVDFANTDIAAPGSTEYGPFPWHRHGRPNCADSANHMFQRDLQWPSRTICSGERLSWESSSDLPMMTTTLLDPCPCLVPSS